MQIKASLESLHRIPWQAVMRCGEEYLRTNPGHTNAKYARYLLAEWGIDITSNDAQIVDEQKYTWFLLRWS